MSLDPNTLESLVDDTVDTQHHISPEQYHKYHFVFLADLFFVNWHKELEPWAKLILPI